MSGFDATAGGASPDAATGAAARPRNDGPAGAPTVGGGGGGAILLLHPEAVAQRWHARAQTVALVHLLPAEAAQILRDGAAVPGLGTDERQLADLVAARVTTAEIARRLALSLRTTQRRLAQLRRRYGAASTDELAGLLTRTGL